MCNIPCQIAYALLAVLYAGSCFGLDKTAVTAAVALAYLMLSLTRH